MIKIFALPGAGSSAITYYRWIKYLSEEFVIIPLDLPGRGMKIREDKILNYVDLIDSFYKDIIKKINNDVDEYIILGNSFSSILAIELCRKIEHMEQLKKPLHLFLAVEPPPHILKVRDKISDDISKIGFIKEVLDIFFSSRIEKINRKEEIINYILESMYKDKSKFIKMNAKDIYSTIFKSEKNIYENTIKLIEFTLEHLNLFLEDEDIIDNLIRDVYEENIRVNTDLTIFCATKDKIAKKTDLIEWRKYTNANFRIEILEGKHTILYDNPELVVKIIKKVLGNYE